MERTADEIQHATIRRLQEYLTKCPRRDEMDVFFSIRFLKRLWGL